MRRLLALGAAGSAAVALAALTWGAVTLLPSSTSTASGSLTACALPTREAIESCLNDRLPAMTLELGPEVSMEALRQLIDKAPLAAAACHAPTHASGRAAYLERGDLSQALAYLKSTCQSGYQHGVFDAWAQAVPRGKQERDAAFGHAAALCDQAPQGWTRYLCFDGMGHAAWLTSDGSLDAAVDVCEESKTVDGRDGCVAGIVMQRFAPVLVDEPVEREPIAELGGVCRQVNDAAWEDALALPETSPRVACRRGAVYPIGMEVANMNPDSAPDDLLERFTELCESLADPRDRYSQRDVEGCLHAWGFAAWSFTRGDETRTRDICTKAGGEWMDACLAQVDEEVRIRRGLD